MNTNKLVRRFAMVALIVLVTLSLNGCCAGGGCPQMAQMLGSAASGACPNGACPNALSSSVTGSLADCANSGNCPNV